MKLNYDELLSSFAFKINLRRYNEDDDVLAQDVDTLLESIPVKLLELAGRGLHSSTFRLNASTFCGIRWEHIFPQSIRQGDTGRLDQNDLG